ncbi:Serine/threonine-protein kinase [Coemansia asiatica]|uniref:non-specific serine/threonine protein kinase n=1 Tax=Coemansia asiatica TaxID=1052880 RepID=A0A9W7XFM6_9FUNG|nr:Serine/threonine-protein kinase [Coemansia asiatica]KAJ2886426.1 Serine/threonine-protein kinase [Coemansia asiatica]
MGQAVSHSLVAAADLQPPLTMGVGGLETALGESPQHIRMLGSTRFMKTILCRLPAEGQLVLRVFMKPVSMAFDPTPQIAALQQLYRRLQGAQHVLSYTRVVSDDRAVYVLRQYLHTSLYDRISTRPFLAPAEKRWIARQLLEALRQAHARGVCHGDIKAENVVVTSWNLAYLADFAPFKPTFLPADDPAEFNFYFDSAARQCCCIAPERFYDPGSDVAQQLMTSVVTGSTDTKSLALRPAMDIFAAGCVIGELLLDGNPLFSLSRLLQYRRGALDPDSLVASISDRPMAALVQHMIQLLPDARLSAEEYIEKWASVLPEAPAAAYMDQATPDERMQRLYEESDQITDATCEIAASVACANVRNCVLPSSRCLGIKVLLRCSRGPMRGDLDVILPYLVALAADVSAQVRAEAIVAIRQLLMDLSSLTPINVGIFDDFLAPHLQYFAADTSVGVRCVVASVLGDWADSAHALRAYACDQFDSQLQSAVARLSFDEAEVKHVLLCSFPQLYDCHAQSLSHIITYLNDRDCWFLRAAFFDVIFAAAARISEHASREYIVPLINLGDQEAFVVVSALRALVRLLPQMSPAMRWDKLVEAYNVQRARSELRLPTEEFVEFLLTNASLPMPEPIARLALEIHAAQVAEQQQQQPRPKNASLEDKQNLSAPEERIIQLREIGAALQTVFLTPVRDPWSVDKKNLLESSFKRKKALELEFSSSVPPVSSGTMIAAAATAAAATGATVSRRLRLDGWRPKGTLIAEISEHNDAVTHVASCMSSGFVTASEDGTLRLFDTGSLRKNAVCRSRDTRTQGGRITGLVYHGSLDCLVSSSDNGTIQVFRATKAQGFSDLLATANLPADEYATSLAFAKGCYSESSAGSTNASVSVVAVTSKSRVLFFSIVDMHIQDTISLHTSYGRPISMTGDGSAFVVIGTSKGTLVLIDTRFRIELKTYRHFLGHAITCLETYSSDSMLVGTAAGDVSSLNLRTGKWPTCVCARSLQQLKSNEVNRRLRVNAIAGLRSTYFISAGNDSMLRYWDLDHLENSYVVNAIDSSATPYSSYRLNDTVYYCENAPVPPRSPSSPRIYSRAAAVAAASAAISDAAISTNNARSGGPIISVAVLSSPMPMIVAGMQSGTIRIFV